MCRDKPTDNQDKPQDVALAEAQAKIYDLQKVLRDLLSADLIHWGPMRTASAEQRADILGRIDRLTADYPAAEGA